MKIVLEPVFEADFLPCSFGFRPKRSAHDALQVLIDESWRGRRWVVETDIANCFSAIPHDKLMQAVEERVCDQAVLKLLRAMLRAGVMERRAGPSGGDRHPARRVVIARCCATSTCTGSTGHGTTREHGVLVRYRRRRAGDVQVPGAGRGRPAAASGTAGRTRLGTEGGQDPDRAPGGRWGGRGLPRLPPPAGASPGSRRASAASPSSPAGPRTRRCSTPATGSGNSRPGPGCCCRLRRSCRTSTGSCAAGPGTSGTGTRPARFSKIRHYARMRLALCHQQAAPTRPTASAGGSLLRFTSERVRPDQPRRNRRRTQGRQALAGEDRMPAVNDVGEPCAGEPHARFDGRELETEPRLATATEKNTQTGNRGHYGSVTYRRATGHRASSRPSTWRQPAWIRTRTALTSSVVRCGQQRILRRIFQVLSWAFARSPGPRRRACAVLTSRWLRDNR